MKIDDGHTGYSAGVTDENMLKTKATTQTIEHHSNQVHGQAYALPISVSANAADDCIFYMKNSSDTDMIIEGLTVGCKDATSDDSLYFKLGDTGTRDSATDVVPINLNTSSGNTASGDFETGVHLNDGTLSGGSEFERILLPDTTDKTSSNFNFTQDVIIKENGTFTIWVGGSGTGTYYITVNFHYHD